MNERACTLVLSAASLSVAACSVIYDPSQFRTTDAGHDVGVEAPDAFGPDAFGADAFGPDAFDLDAFDLDAPAPDLDAFLDPDAASIDASLLDAPLEDVGRDAFGPDATSGACPLSPTSTDLPICTDAPSLYYCTPNDGDLRAISATTAMLAVPSAGHRLGLLGNGLAAWSGTTLADFELAREGDRLAVVTAAGTTLARRTYDVRSTALDEGASETFVGPSGATELGDVALARGAIDSVAVSAVSSSAWATYTCPRTDAACTPTLHGLDMQPTTDTIPLLAYAGSTLVSQLAEPPGRDSWHVQRLAPSPFSSSTFTGPMPERLRSVDADLVLVDGNGATAQRAFEPDDGEIRAHTIGSGEPRLATVTPTTHVIGRTSATSGGVSVSIVGVDCTAAACVCRPTTCAVTGTPEAFVPLPGALVDWTLDVVDTDLRVGVFLVGDSGGTDVLVAWWRPDASRVTVEPVLLASGRGISPPGVGRSVRSVAHRIDEGAIHRLEVFVATHVALGATEYVFLSGLRLEGCSS